MYRLFTIIFVSLGLFSCDSLEKRLDYEEDVLPSTMVFNGFAEVGQTASISLTTSKSILNNDYEYAPLENATLSLYENGALVTSSNTLNAGGKYDLNYVIESDKEYELRADHAIFSQASARTASPSPVNDLVAIGTEIEDDRYFIDISFTDQENTDYYHLLLIDENDIIQGWSTVSEYFEIDAFEGESYFFDNARFSDAAFRGGEASIRIDFQSYDYYGSNPNELTVMVYSCSEDYFLYFETRDAAYNSDAGGLFAQPVQVYSNVNEGLGVFGAFAKAQTQIQF